MLKYQDVDWLKILSRNRFSNHFYFGWTRLREFMCVCGSLSYPQVQCSVYPKLDLKWGGGLHADSHLSPRSQPFYTCATGADTGTPIAVHCTLHQYISAMRSTCGAAFHSTLVPQFTIVHFRSKHQRLQYGTFHSMTAWGYTNQNLTSKGLNFLEVQTSFQDKLK